MIDHPCETARPEIRDVDIGLPGPDEVLVEIRSAAMNWADTQIRRGVYPDMPTPPIIPGLDCAGVVTALGEGISDFSVGDRVAAISPTNTGAFAEMGIFPADHVMALHDRLAYADGAAMLTAGLTAYHLLFTVHSLQPGDTVLIHAVSGGVGSIATQLAVDAGARVIGTTYSPAKIRKALELGAAHVIDRSQEEYADAVLDLTNGDGVNLVINSLGGKTLWRDFDLVTHFGHVINIGEAEDWPQGDLRELRDKMYARTCSFTCFELLHAIPGSRRWKRGVEYVSERIADRRISIPIAEVFPFEECARMFDTLESRLVQGKLLLEVN